MVNTIVHDGGTFPSYPPISSSSGSTPLAVPLSNYTGDSRYVRSMDSGDSYGPLMWLISLFAGHPYADIELERYIR